MKTAWLTIALSLVTSAVWGNPSSENVIEERIYQEFKQNIQNKEAHKQLTGFTAFEQSLFVDALWDLVEDGDPQALKLLKNLNTFYYDLIQELRISILRIKYGRESVLPNDLSKDLINVLKQPDVEIKILYTLAAYEAELLDAGHDEIIDLAKAHPQYFDISEEESKKVVLADEVVADLFHKTPDVTTYMNGEYVNSVKIFMLCRENRLYPCLMIMKDVNGKAVRNADGSLWTNPALASSSRGLPSYSRNGNTPAGIMTIDSVMPVADAQLSFGKFRRMMLNFVPKSKNESLMKSLLPETSKNSEWWKPSIAARDIGRNLFRIHGTGKINVDPTTPYYPFMRTSGCVAQRENTYDGVTYKDQRELLDDVMTAMNMLPSYENEVKIKGLLYLIEIDDLNEPVSSHDLLVRGIE